MNNIKDFNKFFEADVYDISDEVSSRMLSQPKIKEDRYFVVHHTGGLGSASQVVKILNKRERSVQWVVDIEGRIFKTLPTGMKGVHVGRKKQHDKMPGIAGNSESQGVEVIGKNDADIKQRMQSDIRQYGYPRQAEAVRQIIKYLGYNKGDIYSHGDLSKNKADDEGYTIKNWVLANWDKEVDLSGFSKISSTPPRQSSSTPKQETPTQDKGSSSSISISQNYGKGRKFGETEQRKYETYKFNSKVYWGVYDIDRGGFLARSSNSDQLVYAASVSKAVTGACAVNVNGGTLPTKEDMNKLTRFLVKSNNKVWRSITRLAGGGDYINKWAQKMGWNMLPGNYCKVRPAKNNSISAAGMCLFWRDVLNNKFTGAPIIQKLSGACRTSGTRSKVYTPSDCKIGGKTGLYEQYMHDSAWIIAPNGRRYAIVVLTELASASIVATMFGGLYREYCVPSLNAKISKISPKDTAVKQGSSLGSSGKLPIVLIGGLDNRPGDYNIKEQAKLLKTSLLVGQKIFAFRYVNHDNAVEKIKQLGGDCHVVVFSKGGDWSDDCASAIKDKTKMYIVEPYGAGSTAKNSVTTAVKLGVPPQNVIVGSSAGTGDGIVNGASKTPREEEYKAPNGSYHFGALKWVSKVISKL
jgi:hypothetical protein